MTVDDFHLSLTHDRPPSSLSEPLAALWWDAKGNWNQAHGMVDELETPDAMAVHAYLHRKEGADWNAEYWYRRAGTRFYRPHLEAERQALLAGLIGDGLSRNEGAIL